MKPLLRILVIDDSPDDAFLLLREVEKQFNTESERVDSREGLLDALARKKWDIALADLCMPGFGGIEAIRVVKGRELDLPFIVITGKMTEDVAVEAMRAGAHDCLTKSNLARLVPAIQRELVEAASRQERRKAIDQLQHAQKMEAIGKFAGGIAHDFNNILTIINGYSSMLLQELTPGTRHHREVEQIYRAGERAAELTRQILAFSRRQVLEPKILDINAQVRGLHAMVRRLIGEDIQIEYKLTDHIGMIKADPGQMDQILMNLLVNARDALNDGGTITIETAPAVLDEQFVKENEGSVAGHYIMLSVSDNGIGMTEEVRKRLFEPFFTTKQHNQGTGLGLATVYGVVKQSGGYIQVLSEPDKGATFRIFFPCISVVREPSIVQVFEKTRDNTETILVVEDETEVLNLIVYTLNSQGFTVLPSNSPTEAISVFNRHRDRIDLLLSDVVMPFLSGPKLAVKLRELKPDLKVLFMSGHADKSLGVDSLLGDGVSFIPKPFMQGALLGKIRSVLDGVHELPASES